MIKKLVSLLCCLVMLVCFTSCKFNVNDTTKEIKIGNGNITNYSVWGADNLETVIQNPVYNEEYQMSEARLDFSMAKNETENDQIIITAYNDIKSFELITTDLVNGKNQIGKEDIKVFIQKYVFCDDVTEWSSVKAVKDNQCHYYEYFPDMLEYQEVCISYGENFINANNNQGITVMVETKPDTVAGEYTGNFILKIDGNEIAIPVCINVWDFALGNATGKTLFYSQQLGFINGEFDNTDDLYRKYYELSLEYNINLEYLPGFFSFKYNTDSGLFIDELKKYYSHPNFTCFSLPNYELGTWGVMDNLGRELLKEFMLSVARSSNKDLLYIDKMVLNHDSLDEPQISGSEARIKILIEAVNSIEEEVVQTLKNESFFSGWSREDEDRFCKTILNMPQIVTTNIDAVKDYYGDSWNANNVNAYCPTIDFYDDSIKREEYSDFINQNNGEQWFYTCNQPQFPYPSHFTESRLVGNRVLRWMQFKYGIEGYLFWGVNYCGYARNPYIETKLWDGNPNGDGYFFYSGKAYDSLPFPTLKLLAFSDGQDDMDMLYLFKDTYIKTAIEYGYTLKIAEEMFYSLFNEMADRIIDGTTYNFDYNSLASLRKEIAEMILFMQKGELVSYSVSATDATVLVLSHSGKIKLNTEEKTCQVLGDNLYKYEEVVSLTDKSLRINVETNESKISLFVSKIRNRVACSKESIKVNGSTSINVSKKGDILINFETRNDDITFHPTITLQIADFGGQMSFANIDNIRFTYANNSTETYSVLVSVAKGSSTIGLDKFQIKSGETKDISLALIFNNQAGVNYTRYIDKTTTLLITIDNQSGKTLSAMISNLTYTLRGE